MGLARAVRAKDRKDEAFAWPWDRDSHHAVPHHLGGLMSAHTQVHHQRSFNSDFSTDFSTDSDSSSSGGDFMDKYITETGQKPMQVDDDKPKVQSQDTSIPDMASLFGDKPEIPEEQPKSQEPWRSQSTSSDMDNMFGSSFGSFDAPTKPSYDFDAPKKPAHHDSTGNADDMTNLFASADAMGGNSDSGASAPAQAATSDSDSGASGWPWDTHAQKKKTEGHHSRDLWSSDSSPPDSSSSGSTDIMNMFGGSSSDGSSSGSSSGSSGNSDSAQSKSLFDEWSAFGGDKSGVSQPAHAPQQQDNAPERSADSPIQGPTQRESSISGASATDQVVDVRLSSELQQSLLQARNAESRMFQRFRGVSN